MTISSESHRRAMHTSDVLDVRTISRAAASVNRALTNALDVFKGQCVLPKLPRETLLDFCRRMLLIRHFEERLIALHDAGEFRGHYHAYIGQEATGVPALSCLRSDDYIFTTHRNHGHLLARG